MSETRTEPSEDSRDNRAQRLSVADHVAMSQSAAPFPSDQRQERRESRRWWIKLAVQPSLFLVFGLGLIASLGLAQRLGFVSSGLVESKSGVASNEVTFICPMMCTAPQTEEGRCPVCAMELVPATSTGNSDDSNAIEIEPAARRIANIQTVQVIARPATRQIRTVGEIGYDETRMKTLSAYVDARIEKLFVDYTGARVQAGDHLALLYSPKLYSSQVEFLLAFAQHDAEVSPVGDDVSREKMRLANEQFYQSSRQRLIEFGMTEQQLRKLEVSGEANSRLKVSAPIGGTVTQKIAVEGQYISEGEPILKLADLSSVWLMLELFPEQAASIRYGQLVEATVQSIPGREFTGRVAFIDPNVSPQTRTVGVRVVIPNEDGKLRVGDFARATISIAVENANASESPVYDPELADKWMCSTHPHEIHQSEGDCPQCDASLVPSRSLGFADSKSDAQNHLIIPRDAVLMAGEHSVVYVETTSGRFELRPVVTGPTIDDEVVIHEGLQEHDLVATRGNFLIDSQMQLAGNPSLIDPNKARPSGEAEVEDVLPPEVLAALAKLDEADREKATEQKICPVTEMLLGSMGAPPKVTVEGREIFLCCIGCETMLRRDRKKYFTVLDRSSNSSPTVDPKIVKALAQLSDADRKLAESQVNCPVADFPLGSMGPPIKVDVHGVPVFICCEGCRSKLLAEPMVYLAKLDDQATRLESSDAMQDDGLPPIGPIRIEAKDESLPSIGAVRVIEASPVDVPDVLLPPIPNTIRILDTTENEESSTKTDNESPQAAGGAREGAIR